MNKRGNFSKLRAELDEAITYGTRKDALRLASEGLKKAKRGKDYGELEYFKGQIDLLHKKFTSAIEHFDLAVKHNPNDGASYNDRALCMVELGIIDEAFEYFDKGIAAEPDYANIYHNKGWLLNNIGRCKEAIRCFDKALSLEPDRAVTYDNLADAFFSLRNYKNSLAAYKKVLKLLKPGRCKDIKKEILLRINQLEKINP